MAANSGTVTAGVDIVEAAQYNNLRDDVLDPSTGHNHEGGADEGTQLSEDVFPDGALTYAKMADRTRTFAAPAVGGRNLTDGNNLDIKNHGVELPDAKKCQVFCGMITIPADYKDDASTITFTAYFRNANSLTGDMASKAVFTSSGVSGSLESVETLSGTIFESTTSLGSTQLSPGDVVSLNFQRDATDANDTLSGTIYMIGFLVSYSANS